MFQFAFVSTAVQFRFRMEPLSRLPLMTFPALSPAFRAFGIYCKWPTPFALPSKPTPPPPCTATFRFHRPPATPPRTYTPKMASFPHLTRFTNQRKFLKNVSTHTHTQKKVNTKNRFRALTVQNLDRLIPCKVSYCNVANMFLCLKRFVAIIDFLLQFWLSYLSRLRSFFIKLLVVN